MKKRSLFLIPLTLMCLTAFKVDGKEQKTAFVNSQSCLTESKYGKMEQEAFKKMQEEITSLMSDNNKKLKEVKAKLEDSEHMDSLSPDAIAKLEAEKESLEAERGRVQGQYFQMLQQGQYKVHQAVSAHVAEASEKVRKKMGISIVLPKEGTLSYDPQLDITKMVIEQMDASFAEEHKESNETAAPAA